MKNILMNKKMTKAILDGRKVQTRRVADLKNYIKPKITINEFKEYVCEHCGHIAKTYKNEIACLWCLHEWVKPQYKIGETIWVREPAKIVDFNRHGNHGGSYSDTETFTYEYKADGEFRMGGEIPSRFKTIPQWILNCQGIQNGCIKEMARNFLKITNIRVERLQDITLDDIKKEGIEIVESQIDRHSQIKSRYFKINNEIYNHENDAYAELWNKTAPKGYKWKDNPYVFVYEFERVEKPL